MSETPRADRRFPRGLYGVGTEPDPRFSLANERTFLAWIRTSLALMGAGVAVEVLALSIHPGMRLAASIVLILAGIGTSVQAWFGWIRAEKAMRLGRPLPPPTFAGPIAGAVIVAGILVVIGLLLWR
jgi:putative membrane protein